MSVFVIAVDDSLSVRAAVEADGAVAVARAVFAMTLNASAHANPPPPNVPRPHTSTPMKLEQWEGKDEKARNG